MIDYFHFEKYNELAVNYNRDIEMFPVVKRIIERITGKESVYQSPTDMGVNRIGFGIIDDEIVKEACKQEIIRRSFATENDYRKGLIDEEVLNRMRIIMEELELKREDRLPVIPAREYANKVKERFQDIDVPAVIAIELPDGRIITGRSSKLMDACSAAILNSIKTLANIGDEILLLSPVIIEAIQSLKMDSFKGKISSLDANEALIALSIGAVTNPTAKLALDNLVGLRGAQAHSTVMLNDNDEQILKKLGADITTDPIYASENLYYI
jgi:uncharacterized protein (UPF0371 family)